MDNSFRLIESGTEKDVRNVVFCWRMNVFCCRRSYRYIADVNCNISTYVLYYCYSFCGVWEHGGGELWLLWGDLKVEVIGDSMVVWPGCGRVPQVSSRYVSFLQVFQSSVLLASYEISPCLYKSPTCAQCCSIIEMMGNTGSVVSTIA